ncbi:MAG: type VI secretion system contractile sheath large subunit [Polyangiaceae bacterium]|nr:type VI secretion system contractile sheath large subunit [Polyangiaceae bacterium]
MKTKDNGGIAGFGIRFGVGDGPAGVGEVMRESAPLEEERGAFRVLVVADVMPGAEFATSPTPPLAAIPVDVDTLDPLMRTLAPSFVIEVADPVDANGPPVRLDLRLEDLKSFRPAAVLQSSPAIRCWLDAARLLAQLEQGQLGPAEVQGQLERILPRSSWARAIATQLSKGPAIAAVATSERSDRAMATPQAAADDSRLDALLASVDLPGEAAPPAGAGPATPAGAASKGPVAALVSAVARASSSRRSGGQEAGRARALAESSARSLLASVLAHPEFRRLERVWRGLRLILDQATPRSNVVVELVVARADQVAAALTAVARPTARASDGLAADLVVIDQELDASARDLDRIEEWGGIASSIPAPLVVGGTPALLGLGSLEEAGRTRRRLSSSDDPRAAAVRAVCSREPARWVCVALNGAMARDPYTVETSRVRDLPFAEDPEAVAFFLNPAVVVGAIVARAFVRNGHPFACLGPHDGALSGLPLRHLSAPDVATPLAALVSSDAQAEVARAGLALLGGPLNRDTAILAHAPMLYRGPTVAQGGDAAPELGLPDQLFVARVAHAVEQLADAVPAGTPPDVAAQLARALLSRLFPGAGRPAPEIEARVADGKLHVTVRPHRFAQVRLDAVGFAARLG